MSVMILPVNFFNFIDIIESIKSHSFNSLIINKIIDQYIFLKKELKNTLYEYDKYVENYKYDIIDNTNLEHLYDLFDKQKENLKKTLLYLEKNKENEDYERLYHLIDEIYTLFLQLEDRISTLESYSDIENLKATV